MEKIALLITIPSNIKWTDYQKELLEVHDYKSQINFKVNHLPRKVGVGSRCYVKHKGVIKGWQEIVYMGKLNFNCTVTGKHWDGLFVSRSGPFHYIKPVKHDRLVRSFTYINEI